MASTPSRITRDDSSDDEISDDDSGAGGETITHPDLPDPVPFLNQPGNDNQPAAVNNSTVWQEILHDQHLTSNPSSAPDVSLTWAPVGKVSYTFTSDRNSRYFRPFQIDTDSHSNSAWAGENGQSGVMLVREVSSSSTALGLRDAILPAFDIDTTVLDEASVLMSLFNLLDPKASPGAVSFRLQDPPLPNPHDSTDPTSPITWTQHARIPTNAVWCFTSDTDYSVSLTLTYVASINITAIVTWISTNFAGLHPKPKASATDTVLSVAVTLNKRTHFTSADAKSATKSATSTALSLAIQVDSFELYFDFVDDDVSVWLVPTSSENILTLLRRTFGDTSMADSSAFPDDEAASDVGADGSTAVSFASILPWYVQLRLGDLRSSNAKLSWGIGILTTINVGNISNLVYALTYDSASKTFVGRTIFKNDLSSAEMVRNLTWDPRLDPALVLPNSITPNTLPDGLNLFELIGIDSTKAIVPAPVLKQAQITYQRGPISILTMYGRFTFTDVKDDLIPPVFEWTDASIDLQIVKDSASKSTDYTFRATNSFQLTSGDLAATFAFALQLRKTGAKKTWTLHGGARDLSVRLIESFFDKDTGADELAVLENLAITSVDFTWTLESNNAIKTKATQFVADGIVTLGGLNLDLHFQRSPDGWSFSATLSTNTPGATIAQVVDSILPGTSDKFPGFVGDIRLDAGSPGSPVACLEFRPSKDPKKKVASIFTVYIQIAGFSLTFLQYKTRGKDGAKGTLKRVLRISVDQLPLLDKVPLVGQLGQPFDHLAYLWVEDGSNTPVGVTKDEFDEIDGLLRSFGEEWKSPGPPPTVPPLQVKDSNNDKTLSDNVSLAHGHHFLVVVSGKVVLDHVFHTDKKDSAATPSTSTVAPSRAAASAATSSSPGDNSRYPEAQPTKGSTSKSVKPLTVKALTFQYKKGHLIISIDATLKLGSLTFSVLGFTLNVNLQQVQLDNLASIVTKGLISVDLHGIQVGMAQGPLTLDGIFIHDKTPSYESYRGGIAVGFKAWQVLAVGEYYVHLDDKGHEDYKAVFVFGKLDGPLIELEFATISGVRVGFGYNYTVREIDVTELTAFPLISDAGLDGAGNDPLVVLNAFLAPRPDGRKAFVSPQKGSNWFAAGMTITAFDVLSLTAALLVEWDSSAGSSAGLSLRMLADGVFQMEPLAPPDWSLFYIELVVQVDFDFVNGFIAATAAIAPSSHIYVPMARLAGSAAFYTWFGNNPHAGDWVVSIGGYARNYRRPDHYPKCQPVGIAFTVGDCISISGSAYCAVTPKCAMAGGSLHMSLDVGPVGASADLIFDAFINFQPFHFRAGISLSVHCYVHIDIGLIHISIDIHVGADLTVWGPHDFGGRAHVDFWFFGFDIDFGAGENQEAMKGITLQSFRAMLERQGPGTDKPGQDTIGGADSQQTLHKYSVEAGLAPQTTIPAGSGQSGKEFPSTGATSTWSVLAGTMVVRVDCGFALTSGTLVQSDPAKNIDIQLPAGQTKPAALQSWPMHCGPGETLTSTISITIRKDDDPHKRIQDSFRAELVLKSTSKALWGQWTPQEDPLWANSTPDNVKNADNATLDQIQAVRLRAPESHCQRSRIVDLDAAAAMRRNIAGQFQMSTIAAQGDAAQPTAFEPTTAAGETRWADFQAMWLATNKKPASSRVAMLADALEWSIRPPEQMTHNEGVADNGLLVPPARPANAARVRSNGRTDWELVDRQPETTIGFLGIYFPALPQVCV